MDIIREKSQQYLAYISEEDFINSNLLERSSYFSFGAIKQTSMQTNHLGLEYPFFSVLVLHFQNRVTQRPNEWVDIWCYSDPSGLKMSKIIFTSYKNLEKIPDVPKYVSHKPAKNQLQILFFKLNFKYFVF